jgi:hypothetical protein
MEIKVEISYSTTFAKALLKEREKPINGAYVKEHFPIHTPILLVNAGKQMRNKLYSSFNRPDDDKSNAQPCNKTTCESSYLQY